MKYGVYVVSGNREYRGHKPGTTFHARLERNAVARAVARNDITVIGHYTPEVPPDHTFPDGWLPAESTPNHQGRREAPLSLRRE